MTMTAIASLQTETDVASLTPDNPENEMVSTHVHSAVRDTQQESISDPPRRSSSTGVASPRRRRRVRDPPAERLEQNWRLEQREEVLQEGASRPTPQMSSSPLVHVNSVEEEEAHNVGAFVLVEAVDQPTSLEAVRTVEPMEAASGGTTGEAVAVQVDAELNDIQNAVLASATLDDSTQEATVVTSTPSEAEMTEELDEKIAAAMGRSLGLTVERQEEEATVVGITEHDVHPADLPQGEVRATLIGEDYSRTVNVPAGSPSLRSPRHEEEATIVEIEQDVPLTGLSQNEDVPVTSRVARLSPTAVNVSSAVAEAVDNSQEEGMVLGIEHDIHPADFSPNEVAATLIERDSSRAPPPPPPRPCASTPTRRSLSAPPISPSTNPFDDDPNDTPAMSRDGLAALDAAEERSWLDHPPVASPTIPVILPPTVPRSASDPSPSAAGQATTPCAAGLDPPPAEGGNAPEPSAAIPPQRPFRGRGDVPLPEPGGSEGVAARATSVGSSDGTAASSSRTSSSGHWSGSQRLHRFSNMALRSTKDVMEKFLGDPGSRRRNGRKEPLSPAECILQRTLLPWSVFHNDSTNMWIATVNTNQKALDSKNIAEASRALKAFSLPTQRAAEEVGLAMAPPRMLPFDGHPECHICQSKFSVFRRACHCRNCGVCVCSGCSTARLSKMIPATYNIKNESTVNICKSCDWLSSAFRTALLNGQQDEALALYSTGNINVGSPFANVKGELLFPVHCAVMGGNLDLVKWLIDGRCCPIRYMRNRDLAKKKGVPLPLLTSKGRSLLGLALTDKKVATEHKVDIIRYLAVEKNMSLFDEKDLAMPTALMALTAVLHQLPSDSTSEPTNSINADISASIAAALNAASFPNSAENGVTDSQNDDLPAFLATNDDERRQDGSATHVDDCIICYDNPIDCVITPCGHQICCMQCSTNISNCPVCSISCSFIRVYKA